jgi:hypothetical protein
MIYLGDIFTAYGAVRFVLFVKIELYAPIDLHYYLLLLTTKGTISITSRNIEIYRDEMRFHIRFLTCMVNNVDCSPRSVDADTLLNRPYPMSGAQMAARAARAP